MGILREKFAHLNLVYSIGGQISFDIFPQVRFECIVWPMPLDLGYKTCSLATQILLTR